MDNCEIIRKVPCLLFAANKVTKNKLDSRHFLAKFSKRPKKLFQKSYCC